MTSMNYKSLAVAFCLSTSVLASTSMAQGLKCDLALSQKFNVEFNSELSAWTLNTLSGQVVQTLSRSETLPASVLVQEGRVTWMAEQKLKSINTYTGETREVFMGSSVDRKVLANNTDGERVLVLHPHIKTPSLYVFDFQRQTNLEIGGMIRRATRAYKLDLNEVASSDLFLTREAAIDPSFSRIAFNNAEGFLEVYSTVKQATLARIMGLSRHFKFSSSGKFLLMLNSETGLLVANTETGHAYSFRGQEILGNGRKILQASTSLALGKETLEITTVSEDGNGVDVLRYNLSK